jgi:hypothetical protein
MMYNLRLLLQSVWFSHPCLACCAIIYFLVSHGYNDVPHNLRWVGFSKRAQFDGLEYPRQMMILQKFVQLPWETRLASHQIVVTSQMSPNMPICNSLFVARHKAESCTMIVKWVLKW